MGKGGRLSESQITLIKGADPMSGIGDLNVEGWRWKDGKRENDEKTRKPQRGGRCIAIVASPHVKTPEGINKGWWAVPTLQELRTID